MSTDRKIPMHELSSEQNSAVSLEIYDDFIEGRLIISSFPMTDVEDILEEVKATDHKLLLDWVASLWKCKFYEY